MADGRKPIFKILLKKPGIKTIKIEIFQDIDWYDICSKVISSGIGNRYRIRINGKWYRRPNEKYDFFLKSEFKELFWRSLKKYFI